MCGPWCGTGHPLDTNREECSPCPFALCSGTSSPEKGHEVFGDFLPPGEYTALSDDRLSAGDAEKCLSSRQAETRLEGRSPPLT